MGMSQGVYGPVDDGRSRSVLQEVAESGCVFWDTVSLSYPFFIISTEVNPEGGSVWKRA